MIKEQLKDKRYKFEEQIKVYDSHKAELTNEDKYKLVNELLSGSDLWGYFQLIVNISYDLVEDSDKYINLLETINNKIKRDMAQGPFLNSLIEIGRSKSEIAVKLYEQIMEKSKDVDLKIIAGLILGGYSLKDDTTLSEYFKKELSYPLTNSILKAILVKYEHSKLTNEIYSYFDNISKSEKKEILLEYTNICLIFYSKNKKYFYEQILKLIKLNDKNITYVIFDRLTYRDILNQKRIFEIIGVSKDSDELIIDKILEVLRKYPKKYKEISEWVIYWLNKDLEFKLKHLDWVLEELVKQNELFISYFLRHYKKIQTDKSKSYIVILPHLFRTLSKYHTDYALEQVFKFNLKDDDERYLFFELTKVIIGGIYLHAENKEILFKLADNLIKISKNRKFITFNEKNYLQRKNKTAFSKDDYDFVIDFTNNLLEQLRVRKNSYDFSLIHASLKKYPEVYKYAEDVLKNSENAKKYTPLLWLGENEEPKLDDINLAEGESELNKSIKLSFAKNRFWPRAYLSELNGCLPMINTIPNEKYPKKQDLIKNVKSNFSDENSFWDYFSELVFINRLKKEEIKAIEPQVPNRPDKHLDLKVNLFKRNIYFEITNPKMDRGLRLANGAVALGNKSFSAIDKKYGQLFVKKTLGEIKSGKRKDLFFVVLDISSSTIDEHQLLDSFLGSLAFTMQIDKKTGQVVNQFPSRTKDSLYDKNTKTEIISGAIYFKQELIFVDNQPRIRLRGDIIINPNAKNRLNDVDINKLKEIIFR